MTVRGQRILVDTFFRGRSSIPAEAPVIERQDVETGGVQRLEVTAGVTVDGATGGQTEQDPVSAVGSRRSAGRRACSRSCVKESASRRMPSLVVSWMRPFSAAGSRDRERPAWNIRRDSLVQRHATEPDHIITAIKGRRRLGRSAGCRGRGGCASKMKGRVVKLLSKLRPASWRRARRPRRYHGTTGDRCVNVRHHAQVVVPLSLRSPQRHTRDRLR